MTLRRSRLLLPLLVLSIGFPAGAPAAPEGEATPGVSPNAGPIRLPVREKTLANGLKILAVENPGSRQVSGVLLYKVGSVNETTGKTGLAHLFEHLMFKGTSRIGTQDPKRDEEINLELDRIMAELQQANRKIPADVLRNYRELTAAVRMMTGDVETLSKGKPIQRHTGNLAPADLPRVQKELEQKSAERSELLKRHPVLDGLQPLEARIDRLVAEQRKISNGEELWELYTRYGGRGLNAYTSTDQTVYHVALPANALELFFWLESDRMGNAVIREFFPEKDVVKEERRMRVESDPEGPFYEALEAAAYDVHPYGQPIIGWMSDIEQLSRAEAQEFWNIHYAPNNAILCVVGDAKAEEVFRMAEAYFARIPRGPQAPAVRAVEPPQRGEKRLQMSADAQPRVAMAYHIPGSSHPDDPALEVLESVLSGPSGRLNRALVHQKKVAVGSYGGYRAALYPTLFFLEGTIKEGRAAAEVEQALDDVIESIRKDGVTPQELEKARNQAEASLVARMGNDMSFAQALALAEQHGSWRDLEGRLERIQRVTSDDIRRILDAWFVPRNRTVGVLNTK